jgi:hypothetical protein
VRLRELIARISRANGGRISILDVGGRVGYWNRVGLDFLASVQADVTVLNRWSELARGNARVRCVAGNGCDLRYYQDGEFDLVHSNSVIEHVGDWAHMRAFAEETRRVGRAYYVQTPYFWCPIDPHHPRVPGFHWLPRQAKARLLMALPISTCGRVRDLDKAYDCLDHTNMLDRQQFKHLFPDAAFSTERVFGVAKSLIAVREGLR